MDTNSRIPRMLDRGQLYQLLGRGQKRGSFDNWLWRVTRDKAFPRPVAISDRRVAWRDDEVLAWLEAQPRSDRTRSPRPVMARSAR